MCRIQRQESREGPAPETQGLVYTHTNTQTDGAIEGAIKRKDRKEQASTGGLKEHDTFTHYPQLMSPPVAQQMSTDIILFVSVLLHSALVKKKQS